MKKLLKAPKSSVVLEGWADKYVGRLLDQLLTLLPLTITRIIDGVKLDTDSRERIVLRDICLNNLDNAESRQAIKRLSP